MLGPVANCRKEVDLSTRNPYAAGWCCALALVAACAASLESQLWQAAREADTIGAYEGFLERFPSGDLAPRAQGRLHTLREALQGLQGHLSGEVR